MLIRIIIHCALAILFSKYEIDTSITQTIIITILGDFSHTFKSWRTLQARCVYYRVLGVPGLAHAVVVDPVGQGPDVLGVGGVGAAVLVGVVGAHQGAVAEVTIVSQQSVMPPDY